MTLKLLLAICGVYFLALLLTLAIVDAWKSESGNFLVAYCGNYTLSETDMFTGAVVLTFKPAKTTREELKKYVTNWLETENGKKIWKLTILSVSDVQLMEEPKP